jgi:hypothetical protein
MEMEFCGNKKRRRKSRIYFGLNEYADGGEEKTNKEETHGHQSWHTLEELGSYIGSTCVIKLACIMGWATYGPCSNATDGLFVIIVRLGS